MLLLVAIDDGCEDACQVAVRFDFVEFTRFDEGCGHSPVLGACIVACKEGIFAIDSYGSDGALDGV